MGTVPTVFAAQRKPTAAAQTEVSFFPTGATVDGTTYRDGRAVELGLRFTTGVAGSIAGVRFFKASGASGTHTGSVWSSAGTRLATATFANETASGWQEVRFSTPVDASAGTAYTVSYHSDDGTYLSKANAFPGARTAGPLTAPATDNGRYVYGASAFPTQSWQSSDYFVDVIFQYTATTQPSGSQSGSQSASPSVSASASASTPPRSGAWPDASNTGVPPGTVLRKQSGGISITQDGTVIDGVDLNGSFDISASNVVIRNSKITGTNWWGILLRSGTNLTIVNCEIFGDGVRQMQYGILSYEGAVIAKRNNVHHISNGIDVPNGVIEDNFVHTPVFYEGDHTDMIMSEGGAAAGTTLVIRHNTVINTFDQTGAIALFADWGPQHDVTVENNLLAGGGYSLYAGAAGSSNLRILDNVFSKRIWPNGGHWGPVAHWDAGGSGNMWQGNKWEDGTPVNP